jgi:hypothetical protein
MICKGQQVKNGITIFCSGQQPQHYFLDQLTELKTFFTEDEYERKRDCGLIKIVHNQLLKNTNMRRLVIEGCMSTHSLPFVCKNNLFQGKGWAIYLPGLTRIIVGASKEEVLKAAEETTL